MKKIKEQRNIKWIIVEIIADLLSIVYLDNLPSLILSKEAHIKNSQIKHADTVRILFVAMSWSRDTIANSHQTSDNFELPPTPPTPSSLYMEGQNARSGCETSWYHRWSWSSPSNPCSGFDIATDETARLIPPPYIVNFLQNTDSNQNYRTCR